MMVVMGLAGGRHYLALERYAVASAHDRKVMRDGDFDAAKAQASGGAARQANDWMVAFPPHRVVGDVHYVGSAGLASYLITTPQGLILINSNLASSVPYHASQMYARNVATFLAYMMKDGKLQLNQQDEIIRETMVTHGGEIVNARVREFYKLPALTAV